LAGLEHENPELKRRGFDNREAPGVCYGALTVVKRQGFLALA
jgi:hypothetical protein